MRKTATPKDLRAFIEVLQQTKDVAVVEQKVHWDLELGAISRRACELDGPAVWFRHIVDYPHYSILANPRRSQNTIALKKQPPIFRSSGIHELLGCV